MMYIRIAFSIELRLRVSRSLRSLANYYYLLLFVVAIVVVAVVVIINCY